MNAQSSSPSPVPGPNARAHSLTAPIGFGLLSWAVICVGFLGLHRLIQERPQFVGQPLRASRATLIQDSPRLVTRKASDDISVFRWTQPALSDINFNMRGRRDYRGLKTISDMSGQFTARYVVTNSADEPLFALFKCPHPRAEGQDDQSLLAGGLKLRASIAGIQESAKDAWFWSGSIPAHESATVEVDYQVAALKGVSYRISGQDGTALNRVRVSFQRQDLNLVRFESGDGPIDSGTGSVSWERKDFLGPDFFLANIVEGRSLFTSLMQLLEIGPLVSLLFLLATVAVISARQRLTVIQILTLSAAYAVYFPLILYLSSRFSFVVALVIAVLVPGLLLVNYTRWLLGVKLGLLGAPVFLVLYQVFPTLAVFAGWNRGMVLLCLGVVTLGVLINLQNRALRLQGSMAVLLPLLWFAPASTAAEVQLVVPADLLNQGALSARPEPAALVAWQPVKCHARQESGYFSVETEASFEVARASATPAPLFNVPVHLLDYTVKPAEPTIARIVSLTNHLGLLVQSPGRCTLTMRYRAPIENFEGRKRVRIPLPAGAPGTVRVESERQDLEIVTGSLWSRTPADKLMRYEVGVAGEDLLTVEWREQGGAYGAGGGSAGGSPDFYGIGLTRAQNLTVINSDGSCTHFLECTLPAFQKEDFRLRLPADARLISASVNGAEVSAPAVVDRVCRLPLPERAPSQSSHRLSFRLAYPTVRLGFSGSVELNLPEVFQTAGTLDWVVTLPDGFDSQVISSGLDAQKTGADLAAFGDYGKVLKENPQVHLAKTLAPPGLIHLSLKYRQAVPGMYETERKTTDHGP